MLEHWVPTQSGLPHVTDTEALSDHLLLDVKVGREPVTSRVASTMASLQTYLHRLFTGLEPGHGANEVMTQGLRDTWSASLSQYGHWRLLRQLKNYPENRIDPTQRRRKTKAYLDLENLLAQGKFSPDDIEAAILAYMTAVETTSNIQPLTAYHDGIDPLKDTYHFLGKSNVSPAQYYWRTLDMSLRDADGAPSTLGFTAWEPVPIPLTGVIAVTPLPDPASSYQPAGLPALTLEAMKEDLRDGIDTIRPVVIDRRRYVVWAERDTSALTMGKDNKTSPFFVLRVCYCFQQLDGLWSPPNVLITLNGFDGKGKFGGNDTEPEEIPSVNTTGMCARDNAYLKTRAFAPGLVVMVNAKGHRRKDPGLPWCFTRPTSGGIGSRIQTGPRHETTITSSHRGIFSCSKRRNWTVALTERSRRPSSRNGRRSSPTPASFSTST